MTGHSIALQREEIQLHPPELQHKPDKTPPTVRKLHNKENSTNSQNIGRPPQTQQYNQDDEDVRFFINKMNEYWSEVLVGGKNAVCRSLCNRDSAYLQNILFSHTEAHISASVHTYLYIEHINNFQGESHVE